jgi:hypothetical protein
MKTVIVRRPRHSVMDGWPAVSAEIEIDDRVYDIYFRASRGPLSENSDPFMTSALLPAMRLGYPLRVEGAVSPLLLEHIVRAQDILTTWYPEVMQHVDVQAESVAAPARLPDARVGSFFSGGVDSFYNALKHSAEINELIFIHGFDVSLDNSPLRRLVSGKLHSAAHELGKPLLEVETNVRTVLNPYTDWNYHSHGAALGCVAQAVAPRFRRIYIGATHAYDGLCCLGSHPLLDPLWGHEGLELVHDGCEKSRWPKSRSIIGNEIVQRYLRVCYAKPHTEYNCGRCSDCVLTEVFLRVVGMAGQYITFPPLDLALIESVDIPTSALRNHYDQLLALGESTMLAPDVNEALRRRLARADAEGIGRYVISPEMRRAYSEIGSLKADLRRAQAQLAGLRSSRSWRLTAPLRALNRQVRRLLTRP